MRKVTDRLRRDQSGFTLIELLMAASLCLVGLMATISTFEGSRGLVNESERNEVAVHRAERALEDAISRPYANIALSGATAPARNVDPDHPDNKITAGGLFEYRPGSTAPFVLNGALAHVTAWSDSASRLNGNVYLYVSAYDDPSLTGTLNGKRVTVAVTVRNRRKAVFTSTIVRPTG